MRICIFPYTPMHTTKYFFVFASLIFAASLFPRMALAGIVSYSPFSGDFILPKETVIKEDYYVFGGAITLFGTVEGDTSILGGEIVFNGSTSEDALFMAPQVEVNGIIGDDIRLLAAEGVIKTSVPGDVVAVSGIVNIAKDARIFGNLLAFSGEVYMDGDIAGDVKVYGDKVYIDGFVGGDVKVVGQEVVFGERAQIAGDIIWAGKEPVLASGAVVLGEIRSSAAFDDFFFGESDAQPIVSFFLVLKSLMVLLVLLVFSFLFKKQAVLFAEKGAEIKTLSKNAFFGCVLFFASLVIGCLLLVSLVGSLLGVIILGGVVTLFMFSVAGGALLLGRGIFGLIVRDPSISQPPWKLSLVGVVGMFVFGIIPLLGPLVAIFFIFASFGTVVLSIYHVLRGPREMSLPVLPQ